jgi:hypothetical protein
MNNDPPGHGPLPRLPAFAWPRPSALPQDGAQAPRLDATPAETSADAVAATAEPPRFLTVPEVVAILGISEKTVRRRPAQGPARRAADPRPGVY